MSVMLFFCDEMLIPLYKYISTKLNIANNIEITIIGLTKDNAVDHKFLSSELLGKPTTVIIDGIEHLLQNDIEIYLHVLNNIYKYIMTILSVNTCIILQSYALCLNQNEYYCSVYRNKDTSVFYNTVLCFNERNEQEDHHYGNHTVCSLLPKVVHIIPDIWIHHFNLGYSDYCTKTDEIGEIVLLKHNNPCLIGLRYRYLLSSFVYCNYLSIITAEKPDDSEYLKNLIWNIIVFVCFVGESFKKIVSS